ncbi:MAG TPA: LptF/LptG family permease [Pirellulales bacterium]|nr:LptF/LptG family permease [Pirellulales bacterium]
MSLLARYILSEVIQVFVVSVLALTAVFLLCGVGKEAYNNGLPLLAILRLTPYLLPTALLFGVPAALLFAVTTVFGRMSASGEIIAIKALGISPNAVLMPVAVFAVLLSLATFWLNDIAFSWGEIGSRRIVVDAFEEIAYGMLKKRGSFNSPAFSVLVQRVEGHTLINATFKFQESAGSAATTLAAEEAELRSTPGTGVLTVVCRNCRVESAGQTYEYIGTYDYEIPLADSSGDPYAKASASKVPLSVLPKRITDQVAQIERLQQEIGAEVGWRLANGEFNRMGAQAKEQIERVEKAKRELARMRTEPWRRWANGFSCLVFAMVGVPIAILRRHSDAWASFFVCYMPILIVYYPLLTIGVNHAKIGSLHPSVVWLANGVLAAWGAWLLRRVYRY